MAQTPASHETKLGILDFEQLNLHEAKGLLTTWEFLSVQKENLLTPDFINAAHKKGFGFLYEWAGKYRTTSPLVGELQPCAPHVIAEQMKNLCDDFQYRLERTDANNIAAIVELVAWFEHSFICIHPYANTNGRMGRLLTNFILIQLGYPPLLYVSRSQQRNEYIKTMRAADKGDFTPLENFIAEELDAAIQDSETA